MNNPDAPHGIKEYEDVSLVDALSELGITSVE